MKTYTEQQVDDIIRLKFGALVTEHGHRSYASDATLGRIYKCSSTKIRQLYMARFEKIELQKMPLLQSLQRFGQRPARRYWGYRFLRPD